MENNKGTQKDYYVIDVVHILKYIWYRVWIVALVGILTAAIGFSYSTFLVTPTYSSSIMLYVNNSSVSLNDVNLSLSNSDLVASQSLVKTYSVLLKNRTTLERLIEETGVGYSWQQINGMISTSSVNETEIMQITVTTTDPFVAQRIANGIATVLPQRVTEVVEGTSMEVVDSAIPNLQKVAPSTTRYTAIGMLLGVLLAAAILSIRAILDNTIHDEEYIIQNYNYPVLAKIPDLLNSGNKKYGYKYGYRYGYYQKRKKKDVETEEVSGDGKQ